MKNNHLKSVFLTFFVLIGLFFVQQFLYPTTAEAAGRYCFRGVCVNAWPVSFSIENHTDTDGDGFYDVNDECPINEPSKVNDGCMYPAPTISTPYYNSSDGQIHFQVSGDAASVSLKSNDDVVRFTYPDKPRGVRGDYLANKENCLGGAPFSFKIEVSSIGRQTTTDFLQTVSGVCSGPKYPSFLSDQNFSVPSSQHCRITLSSGDIQNATDVLIYKSGALYSVLRCGAAVCNFQQPLNGCADYQVVAFNKGEPVGSQYPTTSRTYTVKDWLENSQEICSPESMSLRKKPQTPNCQEQSGCSLKDETCLVPFNDPAKIAFCFAGWQKSYKKLSCKVPLIYSGESTELRTYPDTTISSNVALNSPGPSLGTAPDFSVISQPVCVGCMGRELVNNGTPFIGSGDALIGNNGSQ